MINKPLLLMIKDPQRIKGDLGVSKAKLAKLQKETYAFWAVCPYSRTALKLIINDEEDFYYVLEDRLVNSRHNTIFEDIAEEIGNALIKKGRIHVLKAGDVGGVIRVDVEFGLPNLLWALYPRGYFDITRSPLVIRMLSAITKPLFFIASPFITLYQKAVYKNVYKSIFKSYPEFVKELKKGMHHAY